MPPKIDLDQASLTTRTRTKRSRPMRCPDCNRFVSFDTETDPDVQTDPEYTDGSVTACVRIHNDCAECGTELTVATFDLEAEVKWAEGFVPDDHQGEAHEIEIADGWEFNRTDRSEMHDRKGRPIRRPADGCRSRDRRAPRPQQRGRLDAPARQANPPESPACAMSAHDTRSLCRDVSGLFTRLAVASRQSDLPPHCRTLVGCCIVGLDLSLREQRRLSRAREQTAEVRGIGGALLRLTNHPLVLALIDTERLVSHLNEWRLRKKANRPRSLYGAAMAGVQDVHAHLDAILTPKPAGRQKGAEAGRQTRDGNLQRVLMRVPA